MESNSAGRRPATATPAISTGLVVRVSANNGKATRTRPSPTEEMPLPAKSRQNGAPRRDFVEGASIEPRQSLANASGKPPLFAGFARFNHRPGLCTF